MVFTSDAKSRWAADWVTWKGFDRFWTNIFRDLLPHSESGEAKADFDSASGDLVVSYQLGRDVAAPAKPPAIYIFGPGGFQHPLPVTELADQAYRGRIHIGQLQGCSAFGRSKNRALFLKSGSTARSRSCSITARIRFYCARSRSLPAAASIQSPARCSTRAPVRNPPRCGSGRDCLALALVLNLAELIMRKGKAVFDSFFAKPAASTRLSRKVANRRRLCAANADGKVRRDRRPDACSIALRTTESPTMASDHGRGPKRAFDIAQRFMRGAEPTPVDQFDVHPVNQQRRGAELADPAPRSCLRRARSKECERDVTITTPSLITIRPGLFSQNSDLG